MGSGAVEGFEAAAEVIGVEEAIEAAAEAVVAIVVVAFDGGFLDGAVDAFDLAVGPGMIGLDEALLGALLDEAAAALGVSRGRLSRIVNGRCGVSAEFALKLEKQGWGTADFWVGLQSNYDLAQVRKQRKQPRPKAA